MELNFKGTLEEFLAVFGSTAPFQTADITDLEGVDALDLGPPPLAVVPAPGETTETGRPPPPTNDAALRAREQVNNLPTLTDEERKEGWKEFSAFCVAWAEGFEDEEAEQPDRVKLMQDLGNSRWVRAILIMAYETGSLQLLVGKALLEEGEPYLGRGSISAYQDYIERLTANMVALSAIAGFPDLSGTLDYSSKWKRS